MCSGLLNPCKLGNSIFVEEVSGFIFRRNSSMQSVDKDQAPRSVASHLGLHCLLTSHSCDSRHIWVHWGNEKQIIIYTVYIHI